MKSWYLIYNILQCLSLPYVHSMTFGDTHDQSPLDDPSMEQTYLRVVFPGGEEQFFRNWECPGGVWAEEMHLRRQPNCVCVKGVYAIGTDLCDEDFMIITGDDHCFDVKDRTIRKFIPLIGKSGFAGRANTVFRKDAPYFARLMSSVPTTSVAEAMHYVFRMNDPNDFTVYAKLDNGQAARLQCLLAQTVPEDPVASPIMQIAQLPNCSNEFRGPKAWCDDFDFAAAYEWTLEVGDSWSPSGHSAKGQKYPGSCTAEGKKGRSAKSSSPNQPLSGKTSGLRKPSSKSKTKSRITRSADVESLPSNNPRFHRSVKGGKKSKKVIGKKKGSDPPGGKKGGSSSLSGRKNGVKGKAGAGSTMENQQPTCDTFEKKVLESPEFDTPADHFIQVEMLESDQSQKFHSASIHQKEINGQNRRVAHSLRKFFMNGTALPKFSQEFVEYKYVQTAKDIFKKVCPEEYLPHRVVDLLAGTFRLLYVDSSTNFPYPLPSNEHEHTRIMDGLNKCKEKALPIAFMTNESNPDLGVFATNQTYNESTVFVYDVNTNLSMPGRTVFNFSSIDIALELVWKMTLLSHYYCTSSFDNPIDLSQFYVKVEAMLKNPIMQFRWYYPGQFNRLMQYFLMAFDLIKFTEGVDRCVATAYASSEYKGWMSRPADLLDYDGGRSKLLSHDVDNMINSPTGNLERSQRKKRFYLQDDMWKRQAYCMHSTDAPYNEVRTSTFPSCKKKPAWFENVA